MKEEWKAGEQLLYGRDVRGGQIEQRQAGLLATRGVRQLRSQGAATNAPAKRPVAATTRISVMSFAFTAVHLLRCYEAQLYGKLGWNMHGCTVAELLGLPFLINHKRHVLLLIAEMLRKDQLQDPTRVVPWRLAVP